MVDVIIVSNNMEVKPIVSVVVPTYNRYQYLYDCVASLHQIQSDKIEFIIQDNTEDNKEFAEYISSLNDTRIKYYHKKEHVSVVENCDMGVHHAVGDYVCMIGDDDTVCKNIIKAAEFLKENDVEGCCFPFPGFNWPDMTFENGKSEEPNMFFKKDADGTYIEINAKEELKKTGCHGSVGNKMPRLYHSLVAKKCLDRIWNKIGTYFPGPSPDMANAVATCLEIKKTIYLSDYLIVSGYGRASARGEGNRNQHFGRIQDKPWLPKDTLAKWDPNLPQIFSGETIIAQSATQALKSYDASSDFKFDYSSVYATFFWHHRDARSEFLKFIAKSPRRILWFIKGVIKRLFKKFSGGGQKTILVESTQCHEFDGSKEDNGRKVYESRISELQVGNDKQGSIDEATEGEAVLVSVIVTVYNMEKLLPKCLTSILEQTYRNLELVVVDDGSTDNSGKICDEFSTLDNRVKVFHQHNKGIAGAINTGLDNITGDYFLFVDSDDYISPLMVARLMKLSTQYDADISQCGRYSFPTEKGIGYIEQKECSPLVFNCREEILNDFFHHGIISRNMAARLFKKILFEGIRCQEGRMVIDAVTLPRVLVRCEKYIVTPEKYYYVYEAPTSATRSNYSIKKWEDCKFANSFIDELITKECPEYKDYAHYKRVYTSLYAYCSIEGLKMSPDRKKIMNEALTMFKTYYPVFSQSDYYKYLETS